MPPSVVNLVQGSGATLGAALTDTPDVDFISFTGGLATGRTIAKVAAEHVTKVAVELGGKNPHIVFADADWDSAVDHVLTGVFLHSGQVCSAGTRLIVEESDRRRLRRRTGGARREDPDRRRHGPGQRDRAAGLRAAPRQGGSPCPAGHFRGREAGHRRRAAQRSRRWPRAASICPRSSTGATGRCESSRRRPSGRSSRWSGSPPRPRRSPSATTRNTVSRRVFGHPIRRGANVWCGRCGTARCGSTTSATTPRRRSGADSGSPATVASSGPTGLAEYQEIKHIWHNTAPTTRRLVQGLRGEDDQSWSIKEPHADSGMEDFGYKESLDRSIGKFASFAAGVSYISILTGTFQLFYFGFGTAGPAYLWSWPMVFVGQMAVALCFMELAAKYPVAGSVYNWSQEARQPAGRLDVGLADAHRVDRDDLGGGAGLPAQPAAAVERLPDHRRRQRRVRLRRQRRPARHRPDRVHHADQRARREVDGEDQQRGCVHRADRRRADRDHPGRSTSNAARRSSSPPTATAPGRAAATWARS